MFKHAPDVKQKEKPKTEIPNVALDNVTKVLPKADSDTFSSESDIPKISNKQQREISMQIDKLVQLTNQAKENGEAAPNYNLCKITVAGTNLYCAGNAGIPREEMPQFKGKPTEGSPAASMEKDINGEVDTEPMFRELLKRKGIKTIQTELPSDSLKATQSELVGAKVAGMAKALENDPNHPKITAPIYVSRDGYVVDGHHRWAAVTTNAIRDGKPANMKVIVIDADIKDVIPMSNKFAEEIGVAAKKADTGKNESVINEIPMADLQQIDKYADRQLNPIDIVLTDKHFFDRLNDTRNGKEISAAELTGFFKRLGRNKKKFVEFLTQYNQVVAKDNRTNINIPFMLQANKAIAKTIMRKGEFKTTTPEYKFESVIAETLDSHLGKKHGVELDVYEYPEYLEIHRIVVPKEKRSEGIGTKVMNDIITYAKKTKKDVFLTPSSDFGGSKGRLIQFYKSFGFKDNKGGTRDFRSKESMKLTVETIKHIDGKWVVYPKDGGDRLGTHDTKEKALKQLRAIEISKNENINSKNHKSDGTIDHNFLQHHKSGTYTPDMGYGAELDTIDFDDSKKTEPGHQTNTKDTEDKGYEMVKKSVEEAYTKGNIFGGKLKIGGVAVPLEVELIGADNKKKVFIVKVVHIDSKYHSKLPSNGILEIPARIFRTPGGGWYKVKTKSAFEGIGMGYPDQAWIDKHKEVLKRLRKKFNAEKLQYNEPYALGGGISERVENGKVICDNCGWSWKISEGGSDTYMCHKCGTDNNPNITEGLLTEGGAYGHMNHPFDTEINLTFGQLKDIVNRALEGKLELTREKTDGQALAISWVNGRLVAARNKGHLANRGEKALDINGVATKFAGRGELEKAYNFAMSDLSKAIKSLSEKQREKVFKNGACFMNLEVIYPTSVNVIPYGQALLVFHGTMEYNEAGIAIGENQEAAKVLAGMIKQVNQNVQSAYTIQGPPVVKLPQSKNLTSLKGKYSGQITKLQSKFKLSDTDGIADYHQAWWTDFVTKKSPSPIDNRTLMGLVKRWAFYDKSFRLDNKNITDAKVLSWATGIDKNDHAKIAKDNIRPFEDIFLGVGSEVLSFMSSVLTANPDSAVRAMKDRLDKTISDVKTGGDEKKIAKLKMELQRLNAIGGKDKIVPNEGIVFVYNGNTMKLTGTFAPLNQILGLFYE
jgi:GNAT superfamily N-acetyltransferase